METIQQADDTLFVKRNEIFYSNYEHIPGYISAATYGGRNNWENFRKDKPNHSPRITKPKQNESLDKSNFDVFSEESSFHGLKHIKGGNNRSRRITYVIILIMAFVGLAYQVQRSVTKYFSYPTNTNLDYVTKSSIVFPKVTLCNINMFKFDEVTPLLGGYVQFFVSGIHFLRNLTPNIGMTTKGQVFEKLNDTTYPGRNTLQEFIRNNAHRIEDMLNVCTFNGIRCGPENFTLTFTNYGACYVFKPTTRMSLKNAGQSHGLSMILNVEHLQYISAPRENVGFRIAIDGNDDAPDLEASGIDVSPGQRASIGLKKQTITSLPHPHGKCVKDGHHQLKYLKKETYTQSRCFLECETDYFMDVCGCRTYYTPGADGNQLFCSPNNLTACYLPKYEEFSDRRLEFCDCKEACSVDNFIKTNSFSGFPSRGVPTTFFVTGQIEYYALAFGFNVEQKMEATRNRISWELLNSVEEIYRETLEELNIPDFLNANIPEEYFKKIEDEMFIFCYDLTYYLIQKISDNIYYDVAAVFAGEDTENRTITGVDSDFYNETLQGAEESLEGQVDNIMASFIELLELGYIPRNVTEEELIYSLLVLLDKLYVISYPEVWHSCYYFGLDIFFTNDLVTLTREYLQDNYAQVDIYFETLDVQEVVKQKAYEFFSIVCDLGGALGLFFGASIVAFIEAIDFWLFEGCCGKKCKRSKGMQ